MHWPRVQCNVLNRVCRLKAIATRDEHVPYDLKDRAGHTFNPSTSSCQKVRVPLLIFFGLALAFSFSHKSAAEPNIFCHLISVKFSLQVYARTECQAIHACCVGMSRDQTLKSRGLQYLSRIATFCRR